MYMPTIHSLMQQIKEQTEEMVREVDELQKPFAGMIDLDAYDEQQACYEQDARMGMI